MRSNDYTSIVVVLIAIAFVALTTTTMFIGIGGWGPTNTADVTIIRTYVDVRKSGDNIQSHYMVSTDQGIFEIDNGILLGLWNADGLYGKLKPGVIYHITTKGRKIVNILIQEYPYIVRVVELPPKSLELKPAAVATQGTKLVHITCTVPEEVQLQPGDRFSIASNGWIIVLSNGWLRDTAK